MSIRLGTSMMRRTRPRFLRTRKLDWTTDGIDFLRLTGARLRAARHEPSCRVGPGPQPDEAAITTSANAGDPGRAWSPPPRGRGASQTKDKTRTDGRDVRLCRPSGRIRLPLKGTGEPYLSSTVAPASVSFFFISSASALEICS